MHTKNTTPVLQELPAIRMFFFLCLILSSNSSIGQIQSNKGIALHDVEGIIERLRDKKAIRKNIHVGVTPIEIFNKINAVTNHVQGVARLSNGNYVFSHDTDSQDRESLLVFPQEDTTVYKIFNNFGDMIQHPGAIQAVGNIIVVPHTSERIITFWDVSDPHNPLQLHHLTRKTNTHDTSPFNLPFNCSDAGIVYHENHNRYYVAVGTAFSDEDFRPILIYASQPNKELTDPTNRFNYLGGFEINQSQGGFSLMYDDSGKLYGADLLRGSDGWENIRLYEVNLDSMRTDTFTQAHTLKKNIRLGSRSGFDRNWFGPGFRWGGTIFPTSPNSVEVIGVERKLVGGVGGPVACAIKTWSDAAIDECAEYKIKVNDENLYIRKFPDPFSIIYAGESGGNWHFKHYPEENNYSIRLGGTNGYLSAPPSPGSLNGNILSLFFNEFEHPELSRWEIVDLGDNTVRLVSKNVYPAGIRKAMKFASANDPNIIMSTNLDMVGIESQKFELVLEPGTVSVDCKDVTITLIDTDEALIEVADVLENYSASTSCAVDFILSNNIFSCTEIGTQQVTLTIDDNQGQSATCISTVTVIDAKEKTLTCPANQTINTNSNCTYLISNNSFDPIAVGFCGAVSMTNSFNNSATLNGAILPKGFTTISFSASDENGNMATCAFNINVVDNQSPSINCPDNFQERFADASTCVFEVFGTALEAGANDNCSVTLTNDFTNSETMLGAELPIGTTNIVYTATDANSNSTSCSIQVKVIDNVLPEARCKPYTVFLDASGNGVLLPEHIDDGSTDNCGISATLISKSQFTCDDIGDHFVTLSVSDQSENIDLCGTTVTVLDSQQCLCPNSNCEPLNTVKIIGPSSVCAGTSPEYSISEDENALGYLWTYASGFTGPNDGTSVHLNGAVNGSIIVEVFNSAFTMSDTLSILLVAPEICDFSECGLSDITVSQADYDSIMPDEIRAQQNISVDANMGNNRVLRFFAPNGIVFNPGSSVEPGTVFDASIEPCAPSIDSKNVRSK